MAGTYLGALIAAYVSGIVQLALFALVMLLASYMMLRPVKLTDKLVIIAPKSYSDLYKYIDVLEEQNLSLDWPTLMLVTVLGIIGSYAGARIAGRMPQDKLKRGFGYFLILMGIYILARSGPEALGLAG